MDKQTISFRLDSDKVDALDVLAKALDRDRTYLLNEAVSAYLDVQQWQVEHIQSFYPAGRCRPVDWSC
jgi:predicted transcriptional regulator